MEETNQIVKPSFLRGKLLAGDRALWVIILVLMAISLLVVYSATNSMAYARAGGDTARYLLNQLRFIALGLGVMWVTHRINYQLYARFASLAFLVALGMQLLTFVIGVNLNSATRAIPIMGLTLQPSDFLKVTLVMVLARQLAKRQNFIEKIDLLPRLFPQGSKKGSNAATLRATTIPLLAPLAVTCALVMPSNLSTAAIIFVACLGMLFIARVRFGEIVRLGLLTLFAGVVAVLLMDALNVARARTWTSRVREFVEMQAAPPADLAEVDPDEEQALNAKIAIASGGALGKGPGHSTQRARLSHSYSDFAYAFIVEEYGMLGGIVVLVLYLWLFFRTITIFQRCGTAFPSLLVLGLGLMIFLQAAINMLVSTGLFFVTGQNLPLVSMGGSSVLFISLSLGMILGVSRQMQEQTLDAPKNESLLEK